VWAGAENSPMFGVCDGHGAQGNHVSNFLTKEFCTHLDAAGLDQNLTDVSFRHLPPPPPPSLLRLPPRRVPPLTLLLLHTASPH
jgi:hypothetical protein